MDSRPPRISASSYSNTAPLIWSFLYGSQHGKVELILDNAPARSAELLTQIRVDAALTPVIAYQHIDDVMLVPDVCVGAKEQVRSVCLATRGMQLEDVRSVALDVSSKTSICLTKIIFREFLGFEPEWREAKPDIDAMLDLSDCALLIGDPALRIADRGLRIADLSSSARIEKSERATDSDDGLLESAIRNPQSAIKTFDLAELWRRHTGLGFVFAMWMTHGEAAPIDFAAARNEGLEHIDEIAANYFNDIDLPLDELKRYLTENISYSVDETMRAGLELYFELAFKHGLIEHNKQLRFTES